MHAHEAIGGGKMEEHGCRFSFDLIQFVAWDLVKANCVRYLRCYRQQARVWALEILCFELQHTVFGYERYLTKSNFHGNGRFDQPILENKERRDSNDSTDETTPKQQ